MNIFVMLMKQIFVILLISVIMLQSFSKLMIIADYELNKDYISKVLCENRSKPQMHCNGKCQLKKQLEKDEKEQNSPFNPLKEKNEVQFFGESRNLFSSINLFVEVQQNIFFLIPESDSHLSAVFQPPAV